MKKRPLSFYVTSVVIALILVNCIVWFIKGDPESREVMIFSLGFLIGMLAMFIAVHLYRWKQKAFVVQIKIVYNKAMAKRNTGVGKKKKSHPHKTQKRLAIKRELLATKKSKQK